MHLRRGLALAATAALPLSALAATTSYADLDPAGAFHRTATYTVFENLPAGTDPASETVAEISAVSGDGATVVHTDSPGQRLGFVDISDPAAPRGLGTLDLGEAEPTSVAVKGDYVLAVVDTSASYDDPSGELRVHRLSDRGAAAPVRVIDLGGQPDSIALSTDGATGAIAIENERDEDENDGEIPQLPAGFVALLDLSGDDPTDWSARKVALTHADGSALPALADAGLHEPTDPEPEYVAFNDAGRLAVSLQENNGVVVIGTDGTVERAWSTGEATVEEVDTTRNGLFDPTDTITVPREPDSIAWIDDTHLATANEGDLRGGSRGWTVFDATSGEVVWDAGNSFEDIATRHGLHNDDRAGKKGAEPEGLTVATIGGKRRAFVGSERSNFVAVYDVTDPAAPVFEQALPTTNGPEGLLAVPSRDLVVVSSEEDDAEDGIRATVGLYEFGPGVPSFPSVVSADTADGHPIGWGALGALSAAPGRPGVLWTASDAAYATGRLYRLDARATPATIDRVVTVTNPDGSTPQVDIEGVHARVQGGFWVASEGRTGAGNALLRLDDEAVVRDDVRLPADIADKVGKWGLEGVTAVGAGDDEVVYVALQRPLFADPAAASGEVDGEGIVRLGRYQVATNEWTWYGYRLDRTSVDGDWLGLSEVTAIDASTLAVIERDKQVGTAAQVKRIYTVRLAGTGGTTEPTLLRKRAAYDVLPAMESLNGWTQEKLEGLTVSAGQVYAVTDNDGLDDATGETQLLRLGGVGEVFRR